MKKVLLILLAGILMPNLSATERTCAQAAKLAGNPARLAHAHTRYKYSVASEEAQPALYVFNRTDRPGFVIVSADDSTAPILGYSDTGYFPEQIPANVSFMLDYMAAAISNPAAQSKTTADYTPIAPLLGNIEWNQDEPYWNLCPIDRYNQKRCYTGCVATAMAQIMRYWQWPERGKGTVSYTWVNCLTPEFAQCYHKVDTVLTADLYTEGYDWANMREQYKKGAGGYNQTEADAVATLMYHCGVAIEMQYSSIGSAAYTEDVAWALMRYFGYSTDIEYVRTRRGFTLQETPEETAERIRIELEEGRPVLMGGQSSYSVSSGHEFVLDGLDAEGMFHVNWGWGGSCNGYYAITSLTPAIPGIGGGEVGDYSYNLDYIIGIEPDYTFDPESETSIRVVTTDEQHSAKYIHQGQLIIEHNGQRYNAQGAQIK